jgi:hypothetical protein
MELSILGSENNLNIVEWAYRVFDMFLSSISKDWWDQLDCSLDITYPYLWTTSTKKSDIFAN